MAKRLPSLDGLRAISISLVILGHMGTCGLAPAFFERYANFGVQIFFVLSGYLITKLLLTERERSGRIDLGAFYYRRVLRIFPPAYVFMLTMLLVNRPAIWSALPALTYTANYAPGAPWYLGHLWSLSVEEQFYLLWPLCLVLFFASRRAILVGAILCAPLTNVLLHFTHLQPYMGMAFPSVTDSLALGCLSAILAPDFSHKLFFCAGPLAVALQTIPSNGPASAAFHVLLIYPLVHVLIAVFLVHSVQREYVLLNFQPLVWIGTISYSLYLWQQAFLNPTRHPGALAPAGALVCAVMSYYFVEQPFLRLRDRRVGRILIVDNAPRI